MNKPKSNTVNFLIGNINNCIQELNDFLLDVFAEKEKECIQEKNIPQGFISIKQFTNNHKFISGNTLAGFCAADHLNVHSIKVNKRWYLHEERILKLLSKFSIYKNRMKNYPEKYGYLLNV